jgi:hypothetical protein
VVLSFYGVREAREKVEAMLLNAYHASESGSSQHTPRRPSYEQVPRHPYRNYLRWTVNSVIAVLVLSVVYFSYVLYSGQFAESADQGFTPSGKPIQIDVLNGCGVAGAASKVTTYLRRRGFDVVEMRNYKSFDVRETLVIDRVGNLAQAQRVAQALGVDSHNVVQEINFDYFVDVSVVLGKDFSSLQVLH